MATWMVHLRIADVVLKHRKELEPAMFSVGNIAPDCGTGVKDSLGEFEPPPKITHWTPSGKKSEIRPADFFEAYLKKKPRDLSALSFYLGYYSHLLTDVLWSQNIFSPAYAMYGLEKEKEGFILEAKKDWNYLDHAFYLSHPGLRTYVLLDNIRSVPDYLPYYKPGQLTKQSRFIADYYKSLKLPLQERQTKYLTDKKAAVFIRQAGAEILQRLNNILLEEDVK